jgi:L-ascorbate metabolism protein UlaG (beta-lactamase superfamily)
MKIQRTANAGILLMLDGKRILLDGVCKPYGAYLQTPPDIRNALLQDIPDALVFTHTHSDHYDSLFVSDYVKNSAGPIVGPADIPYSIQQSAKLGDVCITPFETKHIGNTNCNQHFSFVIQGSKCIWFLGDASILSWKKLQDLPHPDVIVAPYGFLLGNGLSYCQSFSPEKIIVLHLPSRENDPYGLWDILEQTMASKDLQNILIPKIGDYNHICV